MRLLPFAWSIAQATALTLVFDANVLRSVCIFGFFLFVGWFFALRGVGLTWVTFGIVISSVLIYGFDTVIGVQSVTPFLLFLGLLLGFGLTPLLRERNNNALQRLGDYELPALLTAVFLTLRWPQNSSLDYLSLFKYEDNAA